MRYAYFYDEQGRILYVEGVQSEVCDRPIGVGHVVIDELIDPQGFRIVNGELVSLPERPTHATSFDYQQGEWVIDLPRIKKEQHGIIDAVAGATRSRYITTVPGQSDTYSFKYKDAMAYLSDPIGEHPWVAADAIARGITQNEAAKSIIEAHNAWLKQSVVIEQMRTAGKTAVDKATTARAALEAAETIVNALNAL